MKAFADARTVFVDLKGRFMMPGFYDGHSHFMRAGMYAEFYLDVSAYPVGTVRCMDDIRARVRERAAGLSAGEWILCAGYDDTALREARHFTLEELDAMCPNHPLFIRHCTGHCALCNTRALTAAGIGEESLPPPGSRYIRDGNGKLTGLIEEPPAMDFVLESAPVMTEEKWRASVVRATRDYTAKGVTTAHDGGVTTAMWKEKLHEREPAGAA